jgi:long-chain acyl-CoA synthetase
MKNESIRQAGTVCEVFQLRAQASGDAVAYEQEEDGAWKPTTWREYGQAVRAATAGLEALGVPFGSRIAVWGETMAEWTIIDLATMCRGGCTAGIYQTNTPEQAAYIIRDSGAVVVAVDTPERLAQALSIRGETPNVRAYIIWQGPDDPANDVHSLKSIMDRGERHDLEQPGAFLEWIAKVTPETTAVLVYTSGTTGPPKGAMLSHKNCLFCARAMHEQLELREGSTIVSFLPLSHVAEHVVGFISRIYAGSTCFFLPDINRFGEVVRQKTPNTMGAVPRIYEKAYAAIQEKARSGSPLKQRLFHWAIGVGQDAVKTHGLRREGVSMPLKYRIADKLVLSKIRAAFGGRVRYMISGAAPIAPEIIDFFNAVGMPILEVYGMTECAGISHMNTFDHFKVGTVGRVLPGFECKLEPDGEILVRGDGVFQGYLNKPEATAETLEGGWLHTGDIGELDEDGYLRITDRKKNLIVTAGGKNVAPANIEKLLMRDSLISQVVVIGDRRRFLSALITLSAEELDKLSEGSGNGRAALIASEEIQARVRDAVERANKELARYENVREFHVLENEFSVESGEMTPTLKLKRKVIEERHAAIIEKFYAE